MPAPSGSRGDTPKGTPERRSNWLDLLDALPAWISYIDQNQRFRWVNRPNENIFNRPRIEFIGQRIADVTPAELYKLVGPLLERALGGEVIDFAATVDFGDGNLRQIDIHYVPDRDANGAIRGCFTLSTDGSVLRRSEEVRRRTEHLAALGQLAAGIAHEVSNPAASILAAAEMARTMLDAPNARDQLAPVLQRIAAEATRCGRIVQSVLSFADQRPSERRVHDLNGIVTRAVELARPSATANDVLVRFMPAADLPRVEVNDSELAQVVVNLVSNAVQANGTSVNVRTEPHPQGVALVVSDDGVGIPCSELSRVFDPFYTTRSQRGGTGLGLSISHGIIARHGGELYIESTEGRGTTVTAMLPAVEGAAPPD